MSTGARIAPSCSGLMYPAVPTIIPSRVIAGPPSDVSPVALAMPKSITLSAGAPSRRATSTLEGLMSRWMTPFWCACWMASQAWRNSPSRSRSGSCSASANAVIGTPGTCSMAK